eukprot:CAMPEP_0198539588 /NCGR_PEP_ID=MMETSP1462-20131121/49615_1 /TAXON_ID=1333877 /ORGANISM="Brandtodinium nutriculum, Strain RCC3387" /LENGTH=86 /DNA_ID=CAMNT_0044269647 /DNA_START=19 /DNA_END=275 /DNA_ORIENTATION=-
MAWRFAALGFFQLVTHASAASAIVPYACTEGDPLANSAIQVLDPDSIPEDEYYVMRLGSDGKYTLYFKLPKAVIGYDRVNSCGISP